MQHTAFTITKGKIMTRQENSQPAPAGKVTSLLKRSMTAAIFSVAACAMPAAHAALVDFNTSPALILSGGESVQSGNYWATAIDGPVAQALGFTGLAGAIIDGANPLSCDILACPVGNPSQYYAGLNDSAVAITGGHASPFGVNSLKFAFLAPIGGLVDFTYGQLVLTGTRLDGSLISTSRDFPGQDDNGNYVFSEWLLDGLFASENLTSLNISACLFNGIGACVNSFDDPAFNQAQFAIDDLDIRAVPEPSTAFLVMLGLIGIGYAARRRAH